MPLYSNILVAIDCSVADESVLEHVSALARLCGATVHLLHVVHSHTLDQERCLREQSSAHLERYCNRLTLEGVAVRTLLRSGEPEKEILQEIEEHGYDLVAMAVHGHTLPGRILFGSVSRVIREKITIPLLLVRSAH